MARCSFPIVRRAQASILLAAAGLFAISGIRSTGAERTDLERGFNEQVRPFLATYCAGCHTGSSPAAQFDLSPYTSVAAVVEGYGHWNHVLDRLRASDMPPKPARQPRQDERQAVIRWIEEMRTSEAKRNAGDPGLVLARRLSNAEYDYTIRDLTGVDLRPARQFPVDPANQAGFDNSGESLTMSPGLISKYLQAARQVADHMVLKPDGFAFAEHPMLVETDREKYAVQRIVDFYDRQPTDFADYFHAAWRYKHRAVFGKPAATLNDIAAEMKVSPKYLPLVWRTLEETQEEVGPLVKLQAMWRELPVPKSNQPDLAREGCVRMRDFVVRIRRHTQKLIVTPSAEGISANSQPLVTWRNRQVAATHRDIDPAALRVEGEPPAPEMIVTQGPTFGRKEAEDLKVAIAIYKQERLEDPDLVVPAGERARYEAAFARFSSVFPDKFCLRERGRFYPIDALDEGRYLSAGLHNVMGYFRDDTPLIKMTLDDKGKQEIDRLWEEFEFIADFTARTYLQFVFNWGLRLVEERPTFDEALTERSILTMRDFSLARARETNNPVIVQAVKDHFESVNAAVRWAERARAEAEPRHLESLLEFASRAYRRPLERAERDEILAYYRELREKSDLTHEEAMRASIVSLLVSPDFCYRIDLTVGASDGSGEIRPLSNYALASRLSYFLWSSMPDDELRARAEAGDLRKPEVLAAQVRRMMKDPRARGLAVEFAGNWLDFRRFEEHNAVDRERFPSFDNDLRQAMFEEPVRFVEDAIRNDRSVLEMLYGKHTFVNPVLARHYGIPETAGANESWIRVDDASRYGRGGLLPMSVFLTHNSPGLRTSPVKRGYWVVKRVLGEEIPPPPPSVPELPQDEAKLDLPLREMLARHREHPSCAGCHARFDSFGLAFEGYGPVGERRFRDLAGRTVDAEAVFPDGSEGSGYEAVLAYIRKHREKDFLSNLSRKLLTYALGRSLMLSDELLVEQMCKAAAANGYRFGPLLETIVTSPQFMNRRVAALRPEKGE